MPPTARSPPSPSQPPHWCFNGSTSHTRLLQPLASMLTGGRKRNERLSSSCQVGEGKKYQLALDYLVHCSVCFPLLCWMLCIITAFHPKILASRHSLSQPAAEGRHHALGVRVPLLQASHRLPPAYPPHYRVTL